MKKINISIEKMLELEGCKKNTIPLTNNIEELKYWIYSIKMPYEKIVKDIIRYDNSSPKMDELKFINDLQIKYNQSKENIILRIQQVRKIMQYEQQLENNITTKRKIK